MPVILKSMVFMGLTSSSWISACFSSLMRLKQRSSRAMPMELMRPVWLKDGSVVIPIEDRGDVSLYRVSGRGDARPERIVGGARWITGVSAPG